MTTMDKSRDLSTSKWTPCRICNQPNDPNAPEAHAKCDATIESNSRPHIVRIGDGPMRAEWTVPINRDDDDEALPHFHSDGLKYAPNPARFPYCHECADDADAQFEDDDDALRVALDSLTDDDVIALEHGDDTPHSEVFFSPNQRALALSLARINLQECRGIVDAGPRSPGWPRHDRLARLAYADARALVDLLAE